MGLIFMTLIGVIFAPFLIVLAFFAPLIIVPIILVSAFIYLTVQVVRVMVFSFDRASSYQSALSLSTAKGFFIAIVKGNLENLDLSNVRFSNLNLSGISFLNSKLDEPDLHNSNLSKSNFSEIDLCGANMKDCEIFKTNFTGAIFDTLTILPFSFKTALENEMIYIKS